MDTIFALATAQGRAGVAVVRISGDQAVAATARLTQNVPKSRGLRDLFDLDGTLLDQALILRFPHGHSFTGEEVIELHLHGSTAVIAAVLRVLGNMDDLRPAVAGEFTRRALENGQLDLAQVEGLADLIDAETESQRKQAVRVLSGALGDLAEVWRSQLIRAAALIEATIDFADEEVPVDVSPEVLDLIATVQSGLQKETVGVHIAERIREGFEVAIVGAPNVGKSTLLNRLAGRDAAITSEIAGTTRDVIEVRMDLDGLPVTFLDTAGLRDSDDIIENIGVARARERAAAADLRIYMLLPDDNEQLDLVDGDLRVAAKSDISTGIGFSVSGKTGAGVDDLVAAISQALHGRAAGAGLAIRERHRLAMSAAIDHLETAQAGILSEHGMADIIAEDLRSAIRAVDAIVGRIDVEDILGEIFSSFCIGK